MADAALIIVAIVVCVVCIAGIVVFMVYMQHPEDKNTAYFPKFVVLLGLFLACVTTLLLPFDVALKGSDSYQYIGQLWYACYMGIGIMAFAVCPFVMFFYETDEEESGARRLCTAICWTSVFVFCFAMLTGICYVTIGYVQLPVQFNYAPLLDANATLDTDSMGCCTSTPTCDANDNICGPNHQNGIIKIRTSAAIYILAMLSFCGWFLTMSFGGIGLAALPFDLINDFRTRPHPIDLKEFAAKKLEMKGRSAGLLALGKEMESEFRAKPNKRKEKIFCNKFKAMVYELEEEYTKLMICYKESGGNPLIPWFKLFLGIMGMAISISWLVQIVLQIFMKGCEGACPFLNSVFITLNNTFPLFGTCAYGVFAFYLLWAVIKGCMKFGLRFFIISIHPMKVGGTLMNSFLFNTGMILLCTAAIVQFCTTAFSDYARLTAVSQIFVTQVQYLIFLRVFYNLNVFYIIFLCFAGLAFLYGVIEPFCRKKRATTLEGMMHEAKSSGKGRLLK
mmetsp:Transcript_26079/g.60157  ORF Transcript_26079/g.60157 Transcript_26079/m.60157 type:complete len:506 (+) Transcript_26079:76-1593(+)|eukprot:CAMPEP_0114552840 /NCGR_PEP_ID=MMETSP0114-20121206/7335_1 /TAXON_ID=31324 /ORGANISM="Goniomonas sp, Strain m" /LENGTH=505 /DNA_ID=CAMNT_0001737735 /DNA_START=65 /DNA_END=1582 /DNA_ORIENTATION=+